MLNQSEQSNAELKMAESLFLNLCSAATMSTYNTIQMLSLFDHLISEKPEDYTKLLYSKLEEHLTNSHSEKNFDEIKSLPCQEITSLLWTENRNPNSLAINHLKERFLILPSNPMIGFLSVTCSRKFLVCMGQEFQKSLNMIAWTKCFQLLLSQS